MALLNTGEPFGLPKGTVRGIIALASLALTIWAFVAHSPDLLAILAFSGPYLGFYFGTRANAPDAVVEEPLAEPSIGDVVA